MKAPEGGLSGIGVCRMKRAAWGSARQVCGRAAARQSTGLESVVKTALEGIAQRRFEDAPQ